MKTTKDTKLNAGESVVRFVVPLFVFSALSVVEEEVSGIAIEKSEGTAEWVPMTGRVTGDTPRADGRRPAGEERLWKDRNRRSLGNHRRECERRSCLSDVYASASPMSFPTHQYRVEFVLVELEAIERNRYRNRVSRLGARRSRGVARCDRAGRDTVVQLRLGALNLGLEPLIDLHPILDKILKPTAHRLQILKRKPGQSRLNFLDTAHGHTLPHSIVRFKIVTGDCEAVDLTTREPQYFYRAVEEEATQTATE